MVVVMVMSMFTGCNTHQYAETTESLIISAEDLVDYIGKENVVIVDMQAAEGYAAGHVEGAVNIQKDDIVINEVELKDIDAYMQDLTDAPNHCFHYLLIHEQYFYPHYFNYEPDYRERIFAAVDFCVRNGYRPATLTSVALEPRY